MTHDHDLDWAQVARYLSGELSPDEGRTLERRFEDRDGSHQRLVELQAVWKGTASPRGTWDVDAGVRRLRQAVEAAAVPAPVRRAPVFTWPVRRMTPVALAASFVALAFSGAALLSLHRSGKMSRSGAVAMTEVTTPRGQRAEVLLPDGTRVTLGTASRLRYPRDFGVGTRMLHLDGEAYFDVVHDETRPFRVRAGAGELEDVGTAFVVRSYGSPDVRVVVTEGVVVVRRPMAPSDSAVLSAADLAQVDEHGIVRRSRVRVDDYVAWRHGELVFDDATLDEVAAELSRWYDLDVRVATPVSAARRFTGRFRRQPVDAIVRTVAAATDVAIDRTEDGWRFR